MNDFDRDHPRGQLGRFTEKHGTDPGDLGLGNGLERPTADLLAPGQDLWPLIHSGDPAEQVIAAHHLDLTDEQARELARGSFPVRLALATRADHTSAPLVIDDPDPVVRAVVRRYGIGISTDDRERLGRDPAVLRVAGLLQLA